MTYANGAEQSLSYDLAGRLIAEIDAEGAKTQYAYDKVGRLTQVIDALGKKTGYQNNPLDQIAQVKDALGRLTKYEYDKRGNLTVETDALGNKTRYVYTPEGWLASITKPDGKVISYTYDKTGTLLAQDTAGEEAITQSYNDIGQLTTTETKDGITEYQYNGKGQLVQVKHPDGSILGYTYDEYGRKSSLTYPDGKRVHYEYDDMDRLVKVTGLEGEETTYAYDANGQRIRTESDGLTTTYAYDNVGNLIEQKTSGSSALELAYTYTPGGRIASESRTENNETITSQYQYDLLGQLTGFAKSDGYAESYSYDAVGNMKQKVLQQDGASTKLTMTYNKGNQMTEMRSPEGKIGYAYDKNGNLVVKQLGDKRDTYVYDAQDRLTAFVGYDGFEQRYSYDAMGLRNSMEQKGDENRLTLEEQLQGKKLEADAAAPDVDDWVKTSYINDVTLPYGQMLTETTAGKTTAYTYGLERINAQSSSLKTQYVYDGRGSVAQTVVSASTAAMPTVESFAYTPFGEQLGQKQSGFGFNAEWYDAATGMQNLRARQYEPGMMRFSQKDLIRGDVVMPLSLNRYLYVVNDPVNLIDPSGMFFSLANVWNAVVETGKKIIKKVVQTVTNFLASAATEANKRKDAVAAKAFAGLTNWFMGVSYDYLSDTQKDIHDRTKRKLSQPGLSEQDQLAILLDACNEIDVAAKEEAAEKEKQKEEQLESEIAQLLRGLDDLKKGVPGKRIPPEVNSCLDTLNQQLLLLQNEKAYKGMSQIEFLERKKKLLPDARKSIEHAYALDEAERSADSALWDRYVDAVSTYVIDGFDVDGVHRDISIIDKDYIKVPNDTESLINLYYLANKSILSEEGRYWAADLANAITDKFEVKARENNPDYTYPLSRDQVALEIRLHLELDQTIFKNKQSQESDILPNEGGAMQGIMDFLYSIGVR